MLLCHRVSKKSVSSYCIQSDNFVFTLYLLALLSLHILAMIACLFMLAFRLHRCHFKMLSCCFFFCFCTQVLTFLVLDNDFCNGIINDQFRTTLQMDAGLTCKLTTNAHHAIAASVSYFITGVMIIVSSTPKKSVLESLFGNCCEQKNCGGGQQVAPGSTSIPDGNEMQQ